MRRNVRLGRGPITPALGIRSSLMRWAESRPRLNFDATTPAEAARWRQKARRALLRCLGPAPDPVPLRPRVLETRQLDGYRRTTLLLNTGPHLQALCWLCEPDGFSPSRSSKAPAMIATPGHGVGAKDLIALDANGRPRKEGEGYQKDYALQAVRLGYPTLVVEPLGFGERRDRHMFKPPGEAACAAASAVATMLGYTLAGIRVNDLRRALDFLSHHPGGDPSRIGIMGISGGGQMTLWTAAVEPRFKVAIVSGYFNRFRSSVMAIAHCVCNFIPGLARDLEMEDVAAIGAPRPILIQNGTRDPIFPMAATRRAVARLREIYGVFDAADRVEVDIFNGDHQWSPRRVPAFLGKWL